MFINFKPNVELEGNPMYAYARATVNGEEWTWSAPVGRWKDDMLVRRATAAYLKFKDEASKNVKDKRGGSANH